MKLLHLLPLVALAACTVGPDYKGPSPAGAVAPGATFVRAGQTVSNAAPGVAPWWKTLNDPVLDAIEDKALAGNPDLAVSAARVAQARSALRLERANARPNGNADVSYLHATLPGIGLGQQGSGSSGSGNGGSGSGDSSSVDFYNVGFDASWEIDLFGGRRRSVEAARASLEAAEANASDAQVSLSAEIAQAYINLRDRQQRIALAKDDASRQRDILALVEQRHAAGTASALDVETQRSAVEQTDAAVLPLTAERDAYLNALAVLAGEVPGALDTMLTAPAAVPLPPAEVAVGDPAALIRRRPDIRAAERQLAVANARIGVAEAARFPRISFMGLIGIGGTTPGAAFDPDNFSALLAPQLRWNFLDFGRNAAKVGQARSVRDEAEAQYRATVLAALRDAEDALSRFAAHRDTLASAVRSRASAQRAEALMHQRFAGGTATPIDWLNAQRRLLDAEQSVTQATATLTADYAAIQKALGLGWN